jgi:hypothetical protein
LVAQLVQFAQLGSETGGRGGDGSDPSLKSTHLKTSPEQIKASIVLDERTDNDPYRPAALIFYLQNAAKKRQHVKMGVELPMARQ